VLISGVVTSFDTAPPDEAAIANAAALTLFGMSTIAMRSYFPNAMYPDNSLPPSFSIDGRTISNRSCGFFTIAAHASGVYATCSM